MYKRKDMSNHAYKIKQGYAMLVVLIVLTMSLVLLTFIVEVKSLKQQNYTKDFLYLQAKLHLTFLEKVSTTLNESTRKLHLEESGFILEIFQEEKTYELFVSYNEKFIRLHKTIIK